MSYFTTAEKSALIADPSFIDTLYQNHRSRFIADLGPGFAAEIEEHIKFGFCGIVAFDLKQYGTSQAVSMADLLTASALDCDNYAVLTWRLFLLLVPTSTISVAAVGWNGGPIGNHAQIFSNKSADAYGNGGGYWMVDPTVGVILCGYGFDGVARGSPVNTLYLASFYAKCGRVGSATDALHSSVVSALTAGSYRPSHLLYYYTDINRFVAPIQDYADWMTPQASALVQN